MNCIYVSIIHFRHHKVTSHSTPGQYLPMSIFNCINTQLPNHLLFIPKCLLKVSMTKSTGVLAGSNSIAGIASIARAINNVQRKPSTKSRAIAATASGNLCSNGNRTTPKLRASETRAIRLPEGWQLVLKS
jgi:hypothetical protein